MIVQDKVQEKKKRKKEQVKKRAQCKCHPKGFGHHFNESMECKFCNVTHIQHENHPTRCKRPGGHREKSKGE